MAEPLTPLVLASDNPGKLAELRALLTPAGNMDISAQSKWGVTAPPETGLSFVENAILKARHASRHTGLPAIADDSGLEVDALNGAPGIYSARYSDSGDDNDNNDKLLRALKDMPPPRTARFRCLIVFMRHHTDSTPLICQGTWEGEIAHAAAGTNGFGYDSVFYLPERGKTSAQLSAEEKAHLSHRGGAMRQLLEQLPTRLPLPE